MKPKKQIENSTKYVVQHRDPDGRWRDFTIHETRKEAKQCIENKIHPLDFAIVERTEVDVTYN